MQSQMLEVIAAVSDYGKLIRPQDLRQSERQLGSPYASRYRQASLVQ